MLVFFLLSSERYKLSNFRRFESLVKGDLADNGTGYLHFLTFGVIFVQVNDDFLPVFQFFLKGYDEAVHDRAGKQ